MYEPGPHHAAHHGNKRDGPVERPPLGDVRRAELLGGQRLVLPREEGGVACPIDTPNFTGN